MFICLCSSIIIDYLKCPLLRSANRCSIKFDVEKKNKQKKNTIIVNLYFCLKDQKNVSETNTSESIKLNRKKLPSTLLLAT